MAKPKIQIARFDFRGGLNTAISPDLLNSNELVDCTNARIDSVYGGFTKRSGTQRIHSAAFAGTIAGITQWDGPSGKQVVVVANNQLWFRNGFTYATAFTGEGTTPFTANACFFAPFRDATSGAPLVLFIACAGKLFKWTGTVLTDITATTTAADRLIAYHTRIFARNTNYKKHIYWSKVGDGTSFATGTATDGGSAMVDVLNGEEIVALEVIGSSLLLAAEDSIMRFTGHSSENIIIAQDTEGVSSEVGVVGSLAIKRFENVAGFLSDRGPYVATETSVVPIGEAIAPVFDALDITYLSGSFVQYNRGRKELLFGVRVAGDTSRKTIYCQAVRLQAWQGPWSYPFDMSLGCRYEDANNDENWLSGGSDGFVRLMDVGSLDDVLSNGTGGTNITMTVELPTPHFDLPGTTKVLRQMKLQAKLPNGHALAVKTAFDGAALTDGVYVNPPAYDNTARDYRIDHNTGGRRGRIVFSDASAVSPTILGFVLDGYDMQRP